MFSAHTHFYYTTRSFPKATSFTNPLLQAYCTVERRKEGGDSARAECHQVVFTANSFFPQASGSRLIMMTREGKASGPQRPGYGPGPLLADT